jgi:hypothetical protein
MRIIEEIRRWAVESRVKSSEANTYQLPGPPDSQVTIALEYPPSRYLQPGWGSTRSAIAFSTDWFDTYDCQTLLNDVRVPARELVDIPKLFDLSTFPNQRRSGPIHATRRCCKLESRLPIAFVCHHPRYADCFALPPPVDLRESKNREWRGGSSMWITHTQSAKSPPERRRPT